MTLREYSEKNSIPEWLFVQLIREISVSRKGIVGKIQRRQDRIMAYFDSPLISVQKTEVFEGDYNIAYSVVVNGDK